MGCNSHLSIEIKGRWGFGSDKWSVWGLDIPEGRNYRLYEAMAGIRGDEENMVAAPRGIPVDASDPIKYWIKRAGEDGHTHSWLLASEFHKAMIKSESLEDSVWLALDRVLTSLESVYGEEGVRLVFFFDN